MLSVCVKKLIYVEEEKIRLTVLFRSAADKCSAPLSPILFNPRSSVLSVCVKKSICVKEEKIVFVVNKIESKVSKVKMCKIKESKDRNGEEEKCGKKSCKVEM